MAPFRTRGLAPALMLANLSALIATAPSAVHAQEAAPGSPRPAAALHASLWGTVVPIAAGMVLAGTDATDPDGVPAAVLIAGGTILGPTLGLLYAGDDGRAWRGAALRGGVLLGSVVGFALSCDVCLEEDEAGPLIIAGAGAATLIVLAVRDIAAAPRSARAQGDPLRVSAWVRPDRLGFGVVTSWRF